MRGLVEGGDQRRIPEHRAALRDAGLGELDSGAFETLPEHPNARVVRIVGAEETHPGHGAWVSRPSISARGSAHSSAYLRSTWAAASRHTARPRPPSRKPS